MTAAGKPRQLQVIERLQDAMNRHDLDTFVDCLAPDYLSEQPVHPDRRFVGREQARANWTMIFNSVPDLKADLLRAAVDGDSVWTEWHWHGTRRDGASHSIWAMILFGVDGDRISWGRLYLEPEEAGGRGITAAVQDITERST